MPYCSHDRCRRWRPQLLVRLAGIGLRLNDEWFCSAECVARVATRRLLDVQNPAPLTVSSATRIGALLIHQGAITREQLQDALDGQRESGLRLGAEVCRRGFADTATVVRALAAQSGVSCLTAIDASCVRSAPAGLSRDEVRTLGVIPIRMTSHDAVMVACAAPLPRTALAAFAKLTGYTPLPFVVSDDDLAALVTAYGTDLDAARRITLTHVSSFRHAADRIVEAVMHDDSVRIAEAHVDPWTIVRLAGRDGVNAMLVTPSASERDQESEWLAESTRH
jgi:hypothetical protein